VSHNVPYGPGRCEGGGGGGGGEGHCRTAEQRQGPPPEIHPADPMFTRDGRRNIPTEATRTWGSGHVEDVEDAGGGKRANPTGLNGWLTSADTGSMKITNRLAVIFVTGQCS